MKLPKLYYYYADEDLHRRKVRGHLSRYLAIKEEYEDRGGICTTAPYPYAVYNDILIMDTWEQFYDPTYTKTVVITDDEKLSVSNADIAINHHLNAEYLYAYNAPVQLLGSKYFIRRKIFDKLQSRVSEQRAVLFVPGGAREGFWGKVSKDEATALCRSYGYSVFIGETYHPDLFAEIIATKATIVVTAASTSMLEALSLRKPVLAVDTTNRMDMRNNINTIIAKGLGMSYSLASLEMFLKYPYSDIKEQIVATNGTKKVIDKILEELQ